MERRQQGIETITDSYGQLQERLDEQRRREWTDYGTALKAHIEAAAAGVEGLTVPVEIQVDIDTYRRGRAVNDEYGLEDELLDKARAVISTPADLPGTRWNDSNSTDPALVVRPDWASSPACSTAAELLRLDRPLRARSTGPNSALDAIAPAGTYVSFEKLAQPLAGDHLQPRPSLMVDITQQCVTSGGKSGAVVGCCSEEAGPDRGLK
jgi:hypothetical protein